MMEQIDTVNSHNTLAPLKGTGLNFVYRVSSFALEHWDPWILIIYDGRLERASRAAI